MKPVFFALRLFAAFASSALGAHNALLPEPQEIHYGNGTLPLKGLSIRFASSPDAEDQFAAEQLASGLSAFTKVQTPVRGRGQASHSIFLNRSDKGSALPLNNEKAGPDSRESYSIKITPGGAEIGAPS